MQIRIRGRLVAIVGLLALVACYKSAKKDGEIEAPNVQLQKQVVSNLEQMTSLAFTATCPEVLPDTVDIQCSATAASGEVVPVDLQKKEDGFHIVKVGAVFKDNLTKATELTLQQFGFEGTDIKCPDLALNFSEPTCTAQVEGVEMSVVVVLGEKIGARVEKGLIDASTVETHVKETTALPGGVTSADCGKKFYVAKPGMIFQCLAKGPQEEITVHVRIEDASGRVTVSITPFEDE